MFIGGLIILMRIISINSLSITRIVNASYPTGVAFLKTNLTTSRTCLCTCINHPHCLSISVTKLSALMYNCQLYATYPINSSQLLLSSTSNVTIYTDRVLKSVYINNGTTLSNPTTLFSNTNIPWTPVFKIFTGNNQSFLWLNSSNLTTLTSIPKLSINQTESHWFNILISQWNQNLYLPTQVAIAFVVNRTNIYEFLIFNASQSDITTWFSITRLIWNRLWGISQYKSQSEGQQMTAVYTDTYCIRSFNCNFKFSSGCSTDFYGYFFVYGGYRDTCVAAVRDMTKVALPTIYYGTTTAYTNGNLDEYKIADGIMGFVR